MGSMHDAAAIERTRKKLLALTVVMDERIRRLWAAAEATELGWGGISHVANATGISRTTILAGIRDLKAQESLESVTPFRRRPQIPGRDRSRLVGRLGCFGGSHDAWPSRVPVALDLQEHASVGRGTDAPAPS